MRRLKATRTLNFLRCAVKTNSKMHYQPENFEKDYLLAQQLHNEINGDAAQYALQIQMRLDAKEGERAYSQLPLLGPESLKDSQSWLSPSKRYPWQVVRSVPAKDFPLSSANLQSPGRVTKKPTLEKKKQKQLVASFHLNSSLASNEAGPSTSGYTSIKQRITQVPGTSTQDDFKVQGNLKTLTNLDAELDHWKILPSLDPNIAFIFEAIRRRFFQSIRGLSKTKILWNKEANDLSNFEIVLDERRLILLNCKTMLNCSRVNLLSVIFHALIHISVYETSHARSKKMYDHDVNFNGIAKVFNEKLGLQIGTDHTFLQETNENLISYQCQGKCKSGVFLGIIKCPAGHEASLLLNAETYHRQACEGNFHRVFEINNNNEVKHIVHKVFDNTKAPYSEAQTVATAKPRELVDITDEDETHSPRVVKMIPVIDLDDEEFADNKKKMRKIVDHFKAIPDADFEKCLFCHAQLELYGGFQYHIDLCLGTR